MDSDRLDYKVPVPDRFFFFTSWDNYIQDSEIKPRFSEYTNSQLSNLLFYSSHFYPARQNDGIDYNSYLTAVIITEKELCAFKIFVVNSVAWRDIPHEAYCEPAASCVRVQAIPEKRRVTIHWTTSQTSL